MSDIEDYSPKDSQLDFSQFAALLGLFFSQESLKFPKGIDSILRKGETELPTYTALANYEHQLWQTFLSCDQLPESNLELVRLVGMGWLTTIFHQAHAAFQLAAVGLGEVATANVRVAVEHACYLSALVNSEDSNEILNSMEFRHLKGLNRVTEFLSQQDLPENSGLSTIEELMSSIGESKPPTPWADKMEQICNRLNTGERVYLEYRMLSERIHPGIYSVVLPTVFDDLKTATPKQDRFIESSPANMFIRHSLKLAIGACMWAGWAVDQLGATDRFGSLLATFPDDLGFIPLVRKPGSENDS